MVRGLISNTELNECLGSLCYGILSSDSLLLHFPDTPSSSRSGKLSAHYSDGAYSWVNLFATPDTSFVEANLSLPPTISSRMGSSASTGSNLRAIGMLSAFQYLIWSESYSMHAVSKQGVNGIKCQLHG